MCVCVCVSTSVCVHVCVCANFTSLWLPLVVGTRGAWWLRADRQARMRWMAPISRAMRRSSSPSSVVSGVELKRARSTWKGSVGSTLAEGDCRMWPGGGERERDVCNMSRGMS